METHEVQAHPHTNGCGYGQCGYTEGGHERLALERGVANTFVIRLKKWTLAVRIKPVDVF